MDETLCGTNVAPKHIEYALHNYLKCLIKGNLPFFCISFQIINLRSISEIPLKMVATRSKNAKESKLDRQWDSCPTFWNWTLLGKVKKNWNLRYKIWILNQLW